MVIVYIALKVIFKSVFFKLTTFVDWVKDICRVKGVERVALWSPNGDASDKIISAVIEQVSVLHAQLHINAHFPNLNMTR